MDFERLKEGMKEIVEISESVPKTFRKRCFEMLLSQLLSESSNTPTEQPSVPTIKEVEPLPLPVAPDGKTSFEIPLNTPLTIFMRKRKITLEQLGDLLHIEKGENGKSIVHLVLGPNHTIPAAMAQIQWALLLALKSNIETGSDFVIDMEVVRQKCKEESCYDKRNFATIFKKSKAYFKSVPTAKEPTQSLSDEGEIALAELIVTLVGEAK